MSCIRSLVRILPRVQINSLLLEKLCNFFTFSNYYFLPQKTTASQTHFGFTNIWSNMHYFCATAIWNPKISNETPCIQNLFRWNEQLCCSYLHRNFLLWWSAEFWQATPMDSDLFRSFQTPPSQKWSNSISLIYVSPECAEVLSKKQQAGSRRRKMPNLTSFGGVGAIHPLAFTKVEKLGSSKKNFTLF